MKQSWEAAEKEALNNLRALLKLDTTNPPGNERQATDLLASMMGAEGIDPVVLEREATRANLVARVKGRDSELPPLMLSAHTDVVPVERSGWSKDPFGAEIADGCVWGRGALDMKAKLAMDLCVVLAIHRAQLKPDRDLIMAAVADEEAGSELGAEFLVQRHPDLVRAGYVLNEVGGFTMFLGERRMYPIQIAEKGFVTLKMIVRGQPSHGSMPRADSAVNVLCEAVAKLARTPMSQRVTPLMQKLLDTLGIEARNAPWMLRPMLANTVSPTIVRAGYKDNVIPGEAWAILDCRTLPGDDAETLMAEVRSIVGPQPIFELIKAAPGVEATAETPLFELISKKTAAADPGAGTIPWMIPGATDNKFYARLGATCYGFAPVKLDKNLPFGSLFHGNNERIGRRADVSRFEFRPGVFLSQTAVHGRG